MLPLINTPKESVDFLARLCCITNKKRESLKKDDLRETDVLMSKMTLQEQCEGPVMPGLDLDMGDASGAPRPFNQWLETSSLLVSFHLL